MARIEGVCREVCDATEYVTIVTEGLDGPHLAGHWGTGAATCASSSPARRWYSRSAASSAPSTT